MRIRNSYDNFMVRILVTVAMVTATVRESLGATLGDRASAITSEFQQFGGLVNAALVLVGFVLFGGGFLGLRNAQKQQQPIGSHVLTITVGVALLSIGAIITMSSETLTGSDSSELNKIGI